MELDLVFKLGPKVLELKNSAKTKITSLKSKEQGSNLKPRNQHKIPKCQNWDKGSLKNQELDNMGYTLFLPTCML